MKKNENSGIEHVSISNILQLGMSIGQSEGEDYPALDSRHPKRPRPYSPPWGDFNLVATSQIFTGMRFP